MSIILEMKPNYTILRCNFVFCCCFQSPWTLVFVKIIIFISLSVSVFLILLTVPFKPI